MKITIENLKLLPELLKTKTRTEISKEWNVSLGTINYWVKQHRSKGIVIENRKLGKLIDKI